MISQIGGNIVQYNRMPGGKLSEAQRIYCLAQVEAGVRFVVPRDAVRFPGLFRVVLTVCSLQSFCLS